MLPCSQHAYSPQRGAAQGAMPPGRKRDSLTSSTGTSSVRRLIAVVSASPPKGHSLRET